METIEGVPMGAQKASLVGASTEVNAYVDKVAEGLEAAHRIPEASKQEIAFVIDKIADAADYAKATEDLAPNFVVPVLAQGDNQPHKSLIQEEIDGIKEQVNQALSTVIEMVVGLEERMDALDQRIQEFNRRGGHKL